MKTKKEIQDKFDNLRYGRCTDSENPDIDLDIREAETLCWVLGIEPPKRW